MPLREIKKKYTKSDMVIMAWRSQELSHNMRSKANVSEPSTNRKSDRQRDEVQDTVKSAYGLDEINKGSLHNYDGDDTGLEERMGSDIANKLDEDLDLRKLSGKECLKYFGALGISIPVMSIGARPTPVKKQNG